MFSFIVVFIHLENEMDRTCRHISTIQLISDIVIKVMLQQIHRPFCSIKDSIFDMASQFTNNGDLVYQAFTSGIHCPALFKYFLIEKWYSILSFSPFFYTCLFYGMLFAIWKR